MHRPFLQTLTGSPDESRADIQAFGSRCEVAQCVDLPDPAAPAAGAGGRGLEASPINPSDVLTLSAQYGILPKLPAVPGNEGVGRVLEVGDDVKNVKPGDLVLLPAGVGHLARKCSLPAARLVPMPPNADRQQLSMLTVNPPTALLLLRDIVDLEIRRMGHSKRG